MCAVLDLAHKPKQIKHQPKGVQFSNQHPFRLLLGYSWMTYSYETYSQKCGSSFFMMNLLVSSLLPKKLNRLLIDNLENVKSQYFLHFLVLLVLRFKGEWPKSQQKEFNRKYCYASWYWWAMLVRNGSLTK